MFLFGGLVYKEFGNGSGFVGFMGFFVKYL